MTSSSFNSVKLDSLSNQHEIDLPKPAQANEPEDYWQRLLDYIEDDELLDVTPKNVRMRKKKLDANAR